jgi:hypothetical protein
MLYDQHEQAIKHLSNARVVLEGLGDQLPFNDSIKFASEQTTSALTAALLSRTYQYDFAPLADAMKAWR